MTARSPVDERIAEGVAAERRLAVRALLARPLLTPRRANELALVRRHVVWLKEFFLKHLGWSLHVERELVRLAKTPADTSDATRPARSVDGDAFTRRRYVLLCLALASLDRMDRQTTLQRIAEGVVQLVLDDAELRSSGFEFSLERRAERREIVGVMRLLIELEVIVRMQGDEDAFVAERGDALYRIDRAVLSRLLDVRRPPSTIEEVTLDGRIRALLEQPRFDADDVRRRGHRHAVARRLVDDPIVYFDDLSADERDYLQRSRAVLLPQLEEATGLVTELRAEGIALVDPERQLTDLAMPEEGTDGHIALLLAEFLATALRESGAGHVSRGVLESHVRDLVATHGQYWRKTAREPGAEKHLLHSALELLEALRLVTCDGESVRPRAAIARFRLMDPRIEGPST